MHIRIFGMWLLLATMACNTTQLVTNAPEQTPQQVVAPKDKMLAAEAVTQRVIKKHINFLASDELAGRNTPSKELDIAARYIAAELQGYGVDPVPGQNDYFQPIKMAKIEAPNQGVLSFAGKELALNKDFVVLQGRDITDSVELVFVGYGSQSDYADKDVDGKVVVVNCGLNPDQTPMEWLQPGVLNTKREIAVAEGAIGMIELYANQQVPFTLLVNYLTRPQVAISSPKVPDDFVHLWMSTSAQDAINALKSETQAGYLSYEGMTTESFLTKNVAGYIPGSDPTLRDEYVIYCAHYDHVGIGTPVEGDTIYNGARDNGVGTSSILCTAEHLAEHPTKRSALLLFFTGEEKGLLGSAYYADNPLLPLEDASYCLNSDNAGYNDTTIITVFGLGRTTAEPYFHKAAEAFGLKAKDDPAPDQNFFDRSDNVNFAAKGVPAPTYTLGFTAFDDVMMTYYHQPGDDPNSVDYNYLEKFFKTYIYLARQIGNTDKKLFWKKGDKYYDAGVGLYDYDPAQSEASSEK